MGRKLEESGHRKVLEYIVEERVHPSSGKKTKVPRIADMETIKMDRLLEIGVERRYFSDRDFVMRTNFHALMALVKDLLIQGKAVNLDGYFRLEPRLTGNVNATGKISKEANPLEIKVRVLKEMKLEYRDYAWRLKGDRLQKD